MNDEPGDENDGVVILHWAKSLNEARIFKTSLEAYGFHPFIPDDGNAGFGAFGAPFKGGIRIFISSTEFDEAQKLLQSLINDDGSSA